MEQRCQAMESESVHPITPSERNQWLTLPDEALLRQCRVDTMRGTGPGGQKRNKTESAVRLTHSPSGITAQNDVTRSQHLNKGKALDGLRLAIALHIRCQPEPSPLPLPQKKNDVLWIARILDLLESMNYSLADTAKACDISTSQLGKELVKTPQLWTAVNFQRQQRGFPPLR